MYRCNQCFKPFDDRTDLKRHLSTKHFFYFPYGCQICTETDENHTTATEEDMEKHIETVHQGCDYISLDGEDHCQSAPADSEFFFEKATMIKRETVSAIPSAEFPRVLLMNITSSKKKNIEDKIKAAIEECQSTSQNISLGFKNDSHGLHNAPSIEALSRAPTTESGSISSHVAQKQNNSKTIENTAVDDIEIVFDSVSQKVKDEGAVPKNISLDLKNALRRAYNVLCDGTTVDTSAKENERSSSEMNPELSNNEATENITADYKDDYHRKIIVQRQSNVNLTTMDPHAKDLDRDHLTLLATESNSSTNDVPTFALQELQNFPGSPTMSNDTKSQARLKSVVVLDEESKTTNQNRDHPTILATESNSCANDTPIDGLPELQLFQGSASVSNDTQSQTELNLASDETFNQINRENIRHDSAPHGQSTATAIPSVEKIVFSIEQNTDEEFNEAHNSTENAIQMTNNSAAKLVQRKPFEKPHKCDKCPYASARSGALKLHMRTHTGEKPFKCSLCSFVCRMSGHLKVHMRTHTGEKPFQCNLCSYACTRSSDLNRHLRTHTGVKPYKCDKCPYASARNGPLKSHMRTHTGEKPFKCNFCSYACATSSDLSRHLRTHTGVKPYQCSDCSYAGISSSQLKNHVRRHLSKKKE